MKCQICHKNESNVLFTKIINNDKIVMQICTECAREKGLIVEINSTSMTEHDYFKDKETKTVEESIPDITCDNCGLTFAEFKSSGLFGCDKCHIAFGDHLVSLLKQIHGATIHREKMPREITQKAKLKKRLKTLKTELMHCVDIEDYEQAAEIRDQISQLEKGIGIK